VSPRGVFVVVEGIDGAGTTTQCRAYASYLEGQARSVHVTREPSDGPIGRLVRQILRKETAELSRGSAEMMALLFAADRIDHNLSEIDVALARGAVVLSDRYDLSSLAYQSAASDGRGSDTVDWIRGLNRHARRPDVTLVVDVPAELAKSRRAARGEAEELYETSALQSRLAAIYARAEELVPGDRVVHVDGAAPADVVQARMRRALAPYVEASA
jgi:dTMP kinase